MEEGHVWSVLAEHQRTYVKRRMLERAAKEQITDPGVWGRVIYDALSDFGQLTSDVTATANKDRFNEREYLYTSIVRPLLKALPSTVREQVEAIPVGLLRVELIGAETIVAPSGDPVITINIHLLKAIEYYIEQQIAAGLGADRESRREIILRMYKELYVQFASDVSPGWPNTREVLNSNHFAFWARRMSAAKYFVLAHEYAHCVLGHMSLSATRSIRRSTAPTSPGLVGLQHSHKLELEADLAALGWLLNGYQQLPLSFDRATLVFGILDFLVLLCFAERNLPHLNHHSTHPDAWARISHLAIWLADVADENIASAVMTAIDLAKHTPVVDW